MVEPAAAARENEDPVGRECQCLLQRELEVVASFSAGWRTMRAPAASCGRNRFRRRRVEVAHGDGDLQAEGTRVLEAPVHRDDRCVERDGQRSRGTAPPRPATTALTSSDTRSSAGITQIRFCGSAARSTALSARLPRAPRYVNLQSTAVVELLAVSGTSASMRSRSCWRAVNCRITRIASTAATMSMPLATKVVDRRPAEICGLLGASEQCRQTGVERGRCGEVRQGRPAVDEPFDDPPPTRDWKRQHFALLDWGPPSARVASAPDVVRDLLRSPEPPGSARTSPRSPTGLKRVVAPRAGRFACARWNQRRKSTIAITKATKAIDATTSCRRVVRVEALDRYVLAGDEAVHQPYLEPVGHDCQDVGRDDDDQGDDRPACPAGQRLRARSVELDACTSRRSLSAAPDALVAELAEARIGRTFNQYAEGPRAPLLRERLLGYLETRAAARVLLVGEAPGYRGARVSGIPFTSERQLTGIGPAESTATMCTACCASSSSRKRSSLWNVVPTHPGTEVHEPPADALGGGSGLAYARPLGRGRLVVPVGRLAHSVLGGTYVRHPSHGGVRGFRAGVVELLDRASSAPSPA